MRDIDTQPEAPDKSALPSRRTLLKRAGAAGVATAWTIPVVQSLGMSSAAAQGSPPPPTGTGTLSGQVTDAGNALPIQGATVTVSSTGQSATTDSSGNYVINNVPAGSQSVTAAATGYISSTQSTTVPSSGTATLNFALSAVAAGAIRAVLSWGSIPRDLDLHVSGPVSGNPAARFHVYYLHAQQSDASGDPYCALDVDDVDGNGPETQTITISNSEGNYVAGTYRVWVHNYSDNHSDSNNFASGTDPILNLFDQNSQIGSFAQSGAAGDDNKFIWLVAEFDVDDAGNVSNVDALQTMTDGNQSSVF